MRSNERKAAYNKNKKTELKTVLKQSKAALVEGGEDKEKVLRTAQKHLDKAVARGTIHSNTAANYKSKLYRLAAREE